MPRKPKENYHQLNGRPHKGLENPAKFGLTYEQVVSLINTGQWKTFYNTWYSRNRRKEKRLKDLKFKCPVCEKHFHDPKYWVNKGTCCKFCAYFYKGKIRKEVHQTGCSFCNTTKELYTVVGRLALCDQCLTIFKERVNELRSKGIILRSEETS
jgi:hypothetical protein